MPWILESIFTKQRVVSRCTAPRITPDHFFCHGVAVAAKTISELGCLLGYPLGHPLRGVPAPGGGRRSGKFLQGVRRGVPALRTGESPPCSK